ncbi:MFS transporter [Knoellia sp. DB2414S]|uniref:MFS transporter n=2 Tax=Knoellia koreensis TaxID=2730921 RepID=A0A849HA81_9MICO|nr:MFS transporter [Knoellia sp. DB2414S]NNM44815.1 MFS transporter [Knoellia sp. DB2414S]
MLAVSTAAQAASAVVVHGPAFLIPVLHRREGLSLPLAGLVAAAPMIGVLLTLVVWGVVVDRRGERFALLTGLTGTTAAAAVAAAGDSPLWWFVWLLVAGAFAASTNAASGRVVVGWFPAHRRGTAMGIRQMAQPLGVGIAAVSLAVTADRAGVRAALAVPAVVAALALAATLAVVVDPPRPARSAAHAANPYAADRFLARVHLVSVLLVVPQFVVWTYALAWLVSDRGWSAGAAGTLVALAQLMGAAGRIAAGALSDRVGSRMRPLRWVAVTVVVTMLALGAAAGAGWPVAVVLLVVATGLTVADNGLAFTAVAERAGAYWSGRALGIQNTGQFLAAACVPPVAGVLVARRGYAVTFASAAVFAAAAVPLVPRDRDLSATRP